MDRVVLRTVLASLVVSDRVSRVVVVPVVAVPLTVLDTALFPADAMLRIAQSEDE